VAEGTACDLLLDERSRVGNH